MLFGNTGNKLYNELFSQFDSDLKIALSKKDGIINNS